MLRSLVVLCCLSAVCLLGLCVEARWKKKAEQAIGDPTNYQLNIISADGKYCQPSEGAMQFVHCSADAPDELSSFSIEPDTTQSTGSSLLQGGSFLDQEFYLSFRPIGTFPFARLAISQSGYGVIVASSNGLMDPFLPADIRPRPPGTVLPYKFALEADGSAECASGEWGTAGSCPLWLKVKNVIWDLTNPTNQDVQDGYCKIGNMEGDEMMKVGNYSSVIMCHPSMAVGDATRIRLTVAGGHMFKSFNLKSVSTGSLCGFNLDGFFTCNEHIYKCCSLEGGRTSLPTSTWWSYKLLSGHAPLSAETTFSLESWDANLRIPLRQVIVNASTSEVCVKDASDHDNPTPKAIFQLVPAKGDKEVAQGMQVYLYSAGDRAYCRLVSGSRSVICDSAEMVTKRKMQQAYLFEYEETACPMDGEMCGYQDMEE